MRKVKLIGYWSVCRIDISFLPLSVAVCRLRTYLQQKLLPFFFIVSLSAQKQDKQETLEANIQIVTERAKYGHQESVIS